MTNGFSYRLSFIFALVLHLILVIFLFTKFSSAKPKHGLIASNIFINAVAVSERDLNSKINKKKPLPKKTVTKKKVVPKVAKKKKPKPFAKKKETPKKVVNVKKKSVAEKKAEAKEKFLAEKKKKEDEMKKERFRKEILAKRELEIKEALLGELQSERDQLLKELQESERRAIEGKVDKYKALVMQAIDSHWIKPIGINDGDYCRLLINVAPGGAVLNLDIISSSGNGALERSAKASVLKSSPLPVPEDRKLFNEFRVIKVMFRPEGVV